MRRFVRWLARNEIQDARGEGYLRGLRTGREEAPRECGVSYHCPHDFIYDPGQ